MSALEENLASVASPQVVLRVRSTKRRKLQAALFAGLCTGSTWLALVILVALLYDVGKDGLLWAWNRTLTHPANITQLLRQDREFMAAGAEALPGFTGTFAAQGAGYLTGLYNDEDHPDDFAKLAEAVSAAATGDGFVGRMLAYDPYFLESFAEDPKSYFQSLREDDPEGFAGLGIHPGVGAQLGLLGSVFGDFAGSYPSRKPEQAGIKSAWAGSLWMIILTALFAVPIGVAAAVYLEEYSRQTRLSRFIEINIANLAGVPSIVYGLLGLTLFVGVFSALKHAYPQSAVWAEPRNILAGSLTMTLLVLPVIIIAAREAIKAVPGSLRQAAYALGATRWQVVSQHVLPAAAPGIITGVILSISRAIGETAPLIAIGALTYVAFLPKTPLDGFTVLPIQIYNWISRPQEDFKFIAALGIIVLLGILLALNAVAIAIRNHYERKVKW